MFTTEPKDIPSGSNWTLIDFINSQFDSVSVQNTANVMMEYTFNVNVNRGSLLTPYTTLHALQQDVYVRFEDNTQQKGTISLTWEKLDG